MLRPNYRGGVNIPGDSKKKEKSEMKYLPKTKFPKASVCLVLWPTAVCAVRAASLWSDGVTVYAMSKELLL